MRISKIKMAGFKSFVDPTTLSLPGSMTGIVGPNGCGKSNIIDAVQWVMGESSAKHMRGDSMADVIFNGSNTRKPVGQATVELIFDNSDATIGGQYAGYSEISIKRSLGRDAISTYFLNGTRCRRKDITGLFLGTGLGARSYSVIEQGMITRVIEAKPEELRTFLEEAAGISKYKERRRETENRMRHTNENLSRLNDIRDELEKQLSHLQRQAKAAERFRKLKEQERALQGESLGLRWRSLDKDSSDHKHTVVARETAIEAAIAKLRSVETEITRLREQHTEQTEQFNKTQSEFYVIGADISRLEQGIQHGRERRETLEADLARSNENLRDAAIQVETDETKLREIAAAITVAEPQREESESQEKLAYEKLTESESGLQRWQESWDAFNDRAAQASESQQVERARLEHLEDTLASNDGRLSKLVDEREKLASSSVAEQLRDLQFKFGNANDNHIKLNAEFERRAEKARELRSLIDTLNENLAKVRQEVQEAAGRLASLEALQQADLGIDQQQTHAWLAQHELENRPRLHELLEAEAGWEAAVAMVVSVPLDAVCVATLDDVAKHLEEFPVGIVNAVCRAQLPGPDGPQNLATLLPPKGDWLRDKLRVSDQPRHLGGGWDSLLSGIYAAEDLASALQLWPRLAKHESVVTADGVWLGVGWIRVARPDPEHGNVLSREREINSLEEMLGKAGPKADELARRIESARGELKVLEDNDSAATILKASHERLASLRSELAAKQTELVHVRSRLNELNSDFELLDEARGLDQDVVVSIRQRLDVAQSGAANVESERSSLVELRDQIQHELVQSREHWRGIRDEVHAVTVQLETLGSQREALSQSLRRYRQVIEQAQTRTEELTGGLAGSERPEEQMREELAGKLTQRLASEQALAEARASLGSTDEALLAEEQRRSEREQVTQERRDDLEQARVDSRAMEVRLQDVAEQLRESGYVVEEILLTLTAERDSLACNEELQSIERRISRLGAINLAALEEYDELSARKLYLDTQNDDLREALTTLENAIRKIDKETRTKFKETYDKVNSGLQEKFPVLFGGGHAYLELVGDDLLETGVTVMARPPGKRNSTIHLLSGGEKALTALALVFSIFELNPAPFCLLDEVDAPLDDANVARYCDLLKSMADQVQFIFITHNKITMEIAERLLGVTMHEAGVSRFVAVDMDEAVEMVATA